MVYKTILPQNAEQKNIFLADARIKKALIVFAFLAQLISFSTELLGLYPFLKDVFLSFFSSYVANVIALLLASFVCFSLEFLIFHLINFVVESTYNKYYTSSQARRTDKAYNIYKYASAILMLCSLVVISMTLSKRNVSFQLATHQVAASTLAKTAENKLLAQKKEIAKTANEQLAEAKKQLGESKSLVSARYAAALSQKQEELGIITRKEERTGKSYTTSKALVQKEIARTKEKEAIELLELQNKYNTTIATITANQKETETAAEATSKALLYPTVRAETQENQAKKARNMWLSSMLMLLAQFSVIGFCFARVWIVASNCTAGIKKEIIIESNTSSIMAEFFYLLTAYPSRIIQNLIRKQISKIATLEELVTERTHTLVGHKNMAQEQSIFATYAVPKIDKNGTKNVPKKAKKNVPKLASSGTKNIPLCGQKVVQNDIEKDADFTAAADIKKANRVNDRNKKKHKQKQEKRIVVFVQDYVASNGKKPSYQTVANGLGMAKTSVARYCQKLREEGSI